MLSASQALTDSAASPPPVLELNLSLIECFRSNGPRQVVRCAVTITEGQDVRQHMVPESGGWVVTTGQRLPLHTPLFAGPVSRPIDLNVVFFEADEAGLTPAPNDQLGSFGLHLAPDRSLSWTPGPRTTLLGRLSDGRQLIQLLGVHSDFQLTFVVYEKTPL